jgi:N-carbamoylputrescine amidase
MGIFNCLLDYKRFSWSRQYFVKGFPRTNYNDRMSTYSYSKNPPQGFKVTVCELADDVHRFEEQWQALTEHVARQRSQLVLLPEMPFSDWFSRLPEFNLVVWRTALAAHDTWLARLPELAPAIVLSSRPVEKGRKRINEAYVWDIQNGYQAMHTKAYLPDEDRFWEASWYQRGAREFKPYQVGAIKLGVSVCTELWFMQHARQYGQQGIHILANPRATERQTNEKWLAGGQAAAVISGAYCLSSNRVGAADDPGAMGGMGWVIGPDGDVLGRTSAGKPFVTVEISLGKADQAKYTYPRYVED